MTTQVLTLNAGMVPVGVCSMPQSIKMIYTGTAHSVVDSSRTVRSPSIEMAVPSVVRIPGLTFVPEKRVAFSSLNVIYRDDQRCQYCGVRLRVDELTIDHVIPRSRFEQVAQREGIRYSLNSWENCVASCSACNSAKENRLLNEVGIRLLREPCEPAFRPHVVIKRSEAEKRRWIDFLEPFQKFTVLFLT